MSAFMPGVSGPPAEAVTGLPKRPCRLQSVIAHPVTVDVADCTNRSGVTRQHFLADRDDLPLDFLKGQLSLVALQYEPFRIDVFDQSVHLASDVISGSDVGGFDTLLALNRHFGRGQHHLALRVARFVFGQSPGFGKAEITEEVCIHDTAYARLGESARAFL